MLGAVVVASGITTAIVLSGSDNDRVRTSPAATQPTAAAAIVSGAAQQLQTLLQHAQASTYHATYSVAGDAKALGGVQTIDVWHAPPNVREDTALTSGTTTVRTETLSDGQTGQACRQTTGAWTCTPLSAAEAAQAGGFATQIIASLAGGQVAVSTETISGSPAQCFAVAAGAKVCVDAHGIPVLIADADVRYERTALETKIESGAFTPPTG